VDANTSPAQRDPAGADAEFERGSHPGQMSKEVDGRVDHRDIPSVVAQGSHTY
jgi:hypothetical protein